jgi:hypothetical protein
MRDHDAHQAKGGQHWTDVTSFEIRNQEIKDRTQVILSTCPTREVRIEPRREGAGVPAA